VPLDLPIPLVDVALGPMTKVVDELPPPSGRSGSSLSPVALGLGVPAELPVTFGVAVGVGCSVGEMPSRSCGSCGVSGSEPIGADVVGSVGSEGTMGSMGSGIPGMTGSEGTTLGGNMNARGAIQGLDWGSLRCVVGGDVSVLREC
jgi:hypothetical protein